MSTQNSGKLSIDGKYAMILGKRGDFAVASDHFLRIQSKIKQRVAEHSEVFATEREVKAMCDPC